MARLTHQFVNNVSQVGRFFDGGACLHLLVRNGSSGPRKYWIFRATIEGKRRDQSLGSFPEVSLSEARKKAIAKRAALNSGYSLPNELREPRVKVPTFAKFSSDWIEENRQQWSNAKHAEQWNSSLRNYVLPYIGELTLDEVTTEKILTVLQPIWISKTESATRIRERIERILHAAKARGLISGSNPAAWKGHLQFLLPAPTKVKKVSHHASIRYQDLPKLFSSLGNSQSLSSFALRYLILTAGRTSEVIGCKWNEIDGDLWVVGAERMKSRRPHRVPLSTAAQNLLTELRTKFRASEYVFADGSKPISNMAMLKLLKTRWSGQCTVHGMRSSFRTWAAECSNLSPDAAELALSHSVGSALERTYQQSDLLDMRRRLMECWGDFLTVGSDD